MTSQEAPALAERLSRQKSLPLVRPLFASHVYKLLRHLYRWYQRDHREEFASWECWTSKRQVPITSDGILFTMGFGMEMDVTVIHGDALERLRTLSDNSIGLLLTDPPYFIDGMGNDWDLGTLRHRAKPGVVGGIPAGQKFDALQGVELQRFLEPIAKESMRVLKPGAFMLTFSQPRLAHRTAMAIENAGFEIRDLLAWRYEGQAKAFSQDHFVRRRNISERRKQHIIQALGGRKTPQLKPQMENIVLAQSPRDGTFVDNWLEWQTGLVDFADPVLGGGGGFPGTVMECPKPRERHGHMTVKPVDLCRHLIRLFSAPGAVVLDPFAGTGTTGVAAVVEGRTFVGIERDSEMVAVIDARLAKARSHE